MTISTDETNPPEKLTAASKPSGILSTSPASGKPIQVQNVGQASSENAKPGAPRRYQTRSQTAGATPSSSSTRSAKQVTSVSTTTTTRRTGNRKAVLTRSSDEQLSLPPKKRSKSASLEEEEDEEEEEEQVKQLPRGLGEPSIPSSSSSAATHAGRPLPKLRANLPEPVPNLTKKSRGRRVPTNPAMAVEGGSKDKQRRLYVCKVEGCAKCFHRGEHLKRHIRSIHTHEKPFKCAHPSCDKFFNRHDNLLQHLKVHKDLPSRNSTPSSSSTPLIPEQSEISQRQSGSPPVSNPLLPFIAYTGYDPTASSSTTNMAVSSLRTEIPSLDNTSSPEHSMSPGPPVDVRGLSMMRVDSGSGSDHPPRLNPVQQPMMLRPTLAHDWHT